MELATETDASIFIVEDDPHFRETFVDVMSLRGFEVQSAGSGSEGLRALRDTSPSVIILDVQLPDVHGFDLCRLIKRQDALKNTPVIFISASTHYNDPRDQVEGLLAGADLFLPKPITVEHLWTEIKGLLARRSS